MICKYCGMESTTTDLCSMCGQILTPSAAEDAKQQNVPVEQNEAASSAAVESAAPTQAEAAAPVIQSTAESEPVSTVRANKQATGPRRPAPAVVPRAGGKAGHMPAPPLPTSTSRPPVPDFRNIKPAETGAPQSRPSLADPLSDYTAFSEVKTAPAAPTLLNPDAEPISAPVETPSIPAGVTGVAAGADTLSPAPPGAQRASTGDAAFTRTTAKRGRDEVGIEELDANRLTARYAGAFALILVATWALAFLGKHFYAVPLVLAEFFGALLLPLMRVVPWAEEDSDDLAWFILLTLMLGPIFALVAYVLISLIRQTANPAIVGCLLVAALSRLAVQAALGRFLLTDTMPLFIHSNFGMGLVKHLLLDWSGFVSLAGWYTASMFHKFDE